MRAVFVWQGRALFDALMRLEYFAGMSGIRFFGRRQRAWRGVACAVALALFLVLGHGTGCTTSADELAWAKWIPDGDTVQLVGGTWVRLTGIDAPETGKHGAPGQYYSGRSRGALQELVGGRPFHVRPVGRGADRYGRVLGEIILLDGTNVNEELLRSGHASLYWFPDHPAELISRYIAVQREAISHERGFWPRVLGQPVARGPWVGNARSHRAYPAGNSRVKKISPRNRVEFSSLEDVYMHGYSAARSLSPWWQVR